MKTKAIFIKPHLLLIFLFFSFTSNLLSQEKAKPLHDTKIMRNVSMIDIDGKEYRNVKVTLKSISPDYFFSNRYRVKVNIVNVNGITIWRKTLKNVYLYVFSDGQIQVANGNFLKILIKKDRSGSFSGEIREKEGIY